jgi:hypothetical protein
MRSHTLLLLACAGLAVTAETGPVVPAASAAPAADAQPWRFLIAPYVLFPNIEIANKSGTLPLVYADLSYSDVLDNASSGFAVRGEIWRGRLGLLLDVAHLDIKGENIASIPVNDGSGVTASRSLTVGNEQLVIEAMAAYEVSPGFVLYGGIRSWDLTMTMDASLIGSGGADASRSYTFEEDWIDPVIGFRGTSDLNAKVYLTGWFDLGGGLYGSEWSTSSAFYLGWKTNPHLHLLAGFEAQYVYFENDESGENRFTYENFTYGPVLSAAALF